MSIDQLKLEIIDLVKTDEINIAKITQLLDIDFFQDPSFMIEVKKVVEIITRDRNNNLRFDIDDIRLISTDPMAIVSLITSILIIVSMITKLKYKKGSAEQFTFKLICYIFLVVVPKETNITFSLTDKKQILDACCDIYTFIQASQIVKQVFNKIKKWLKSTCTKQVDKSSVLNDKLLKQKTLLHSSMSLIKVDQINNF